jgi:hypothetical protein
MWELAKAGLWVLLVAASMAEQWAVWSAGEMVAGLEEKLVDSWVFA